MLSNLYLIPFIFTILMLLFVLLSSKENRIKYKGIFYSIIAFNFLFAIGINLFYDNYFKEIKMEVEKFTNNQNDILDSIESEIYKPITHTSIEDLEKIKKKNSDLIELLNSENKRLQKYKSELENIENIIGKKNDTKNDIIRQMDLNTQDVKAISHFNKRIDNQILKNNKGHMVSGQSSKFYFSCPKDFNIDSLGLTLKFVNDQIIDSIAYISINFSEVVGEKNWNGLHTELYEPKRGINSFRIKNYFKGAEGRKINLEVGFVMKSELTNEYPRFERRICKNY